VSAGGGDLLRGIRGGLGLARFDRRALELLRIDVGGFWHSFTALLLAIPGYLLLYSLPVPGQGVATPSPDEEAAADVIATMAAGTDHFGLLGDVLVDLLAWASFPLVLLILARRTGVDRGFVPYVVARNWLSMVQVYVMVAVIATAGVLPAPLAGLLTTLALAALIGMEWFMTRLTLGLNSGAVTLIVLMAILWPILLARLL